MSTWTDLATIQMRNAMYASADAQDRLVLENARRNEILRESELARNSEMERQFNIQQERAKQERYAKGLLVKAELTLENNDFKELNIEDISSIIGELNSLIEFSEKQKLLEDFFQEIEDIRFAHKTINLVKSSLIVARNHQNILLQREQEILVRSENQKLLNNLHDLLNHYEKQTHYLKKSLEDSKEKIEFYSKELFQANWFISNSGLIPDDFTKDADNRSVLENAIKETRQYIKEISTKIPSKVHDEVNNLHESISDWCQIYYKGECFEVLKQFKPRDFSEFKGFNMCPVCDKQLKLSEANRKDGLTIVFCGDQSSEEINKVAEEYDVFEAKAYTHFFMSTLDAEFCQFILKSCINSYQEKNRKLEADLNEAKSELENSKSKFFGNGAIKQKISSIERKLLSSKKEILPIESQESTISSRVEEILKHNKEQFEKFMQRKGQLFNSCFGYVPEDPDEASYLIASNFMRYQSFYEDSQQIYPWSFSNDKFQILIQNV